MYACICRQISEATVRGAGRAGTTTPDGLIVLLGLDDAGCCGRCVRHIDEFVELATKGASVPADLASSRSPVYA